jgi:hypothetical protein
MFSDVFHPNFLVYTNAFGFIVLLLFFSSTGFYSPYRTLAFLNGLLDSQTFGRTPWLGDQSNARPLPKHRTTQHRNTQTHIHDPSRIRTCDHNVQAVVVLDRSAIETGSLVTYILFISLTIVKTLPQFKLLQLSFRIREVPHPCTGRLGFHRFPQSVQTSFWDNGLK